MAYTYAHPHMAVTVDAVVFGEGLDGREVLLIRRARDPFKDRWALPGGYVDIDETVAAAARRELSEEAGLDVPDLAFLGYFDAVDRDPRERTLSLAFTGRVDRDQARIKAGDDAAEARWFPVSALPELAFDHGVIIERAIKAG